MITPQIELQHQVRIGASFDSIWIINSLEPPNQPDRQLATTSDVTVWRRLIANNYRWCPAKGSILTVSHRRELLQWTMQCQNWCLQQWRNIILSDGIWYCISNADGRPMVLRQRGECYYNAYIRERDTCGRPNIMVWNRMVINFKPGLIIFQKNGPGIGNGVMATH